jgi:uncharacterized protein YbaR (Trm112 family)
MQRSFGFDVLACPHCPGRLTLVALIQAPAVIARILTHLGLPVACQSVGRAHAGALQSAKYRRLRAPDSNPQLTHDGWIHRRQRVGLPSARSCAELSAL